MLRKIEEETRFYILEHDDENDEYVLDVLCGTVAQYNITVRLTPEEITEYKTNPASLRELADKISYSPDSYRPRHIATHDTDK